MVAGVTFKDDSTIERLERRGFSRTWRIDVAGDLGDTGPGAGPETVQERLDATKAHEIALAKGRADVLIVRHVVEHAQDPATFVSALKRLVKPGGYLVIEVPDCAPALERGDYTMLWEEHVLYFTEALLRQAIACWRLSPISVLLYPYSHENSLVAVLRSTDATFPFMVPRTTDDVLAVGEGYAARFPAYRQAARDRLRAFRREVGDIALFGAGHLSCTWLNIVCAGHEVDFVVDDDHRKQGLLMPGSHAPILGSSQLIDRNVRLCLLGLNQEGERKVIAANQRFLDGGGRFATIFPGRPNSFVM